MTNDSEDEFLIVFLLSAEQECDFINGSPERVCQQNLVSQVLCVELSQNRVDRCMTNYVVGSTDDP